MGLFTYTLEVPTEDPVENKLLGYRVPRTVLLPPYLLSNDYYVEYAEALDTVLGPAVDEKIEIIKNLRNMWVTDPSLAQNYIYADPTGYDDQNRPIVPMIPFEAWPQFEREIMVKQVNALGMKLQSAGLITDDQYQIISRWVGQYWFGKGTQSFINFINYCLSSSLTVQRLWTEDYTNFYADGDSTIGTPIWEGGTWYPTSHVTITAAGGLQTIDPTSLVTFFYEIANYNLVLQSLVLSYDLWMVDQLLPNYEEAVVVATGLWADSSIVISNFAQYGASTPTSYNLEPDMTMSALVTSSGMTGAYLLAAPSSWIEQDGKKFPVYTTTDMTVTTSSSLPTTVMGGPSLNGQANGYYVLYGPVSWVQVPGSSRSSARIPAYTAQPTAKTVLLQQIPLAMVGTARANILVNPDGWEDVDNTGLLSPYWLATD